MSRSLERAYRFSRFHVKAGASWRAARTMTDALPASQEFERTMQSLRSGLMVYAADGGVRFLTGHVWYTKAVRRLRDEGYLIMTCLRDPVDRLISHYLYNRFTENTHVAIDVDIDDFLSSERARQLATIYARYLSGGREGNDYTSADAIAEARAGLESMDHVGVLDDLDGFLRKAGQIIGVRLKSFHRRKSPALGREEYRIRRSAEVRARAAALCSADTEIYEHAQKLASRAQER